MTDMPPRSATPEPRCVCGKDEMHRVHNEEREHAFHPYHTEARSVPHPTSEADSMTDMPPRSATPEPRRGDCVQCSHPWEDHYDFVSVPRIGCRQCLCRYIPEARSVPQSEREGLRELIDGYKRLLKIRHDSAHRGGIFDGGEDFTECSLCEGGFDLIRAALHPEPRRRASRCCTRSVAHSTRLTRGSR